MIVAIDGPAGAGKTTVSLMVAERLGFELISTGALYRAVGLIAARRGVSLDDEAALAAIAVALQVRFEVRDGVNRVHLDGEDITDALRTAEATHAASVVSAIGAVRDALVDLQRSYGATRDVVMEGRDIGTVIFPAAEHKFFLTASTVERARRRQRDYQAAGTPRTLDDVVDEIVVRDRRDSERDVAPLRQADDAVLVDATDLTIDAVVDAIAGAVEARRA